MESEVSYEEFFALFNFQPQFSNCFGVERECHLADELGTIAPIAPIILPTLRRCAQQPFMYELSSTQLETHTPHPSPLSGIRVLMRESDEEARRAEKHLGFRRIFHGPGPEDIPLNVFPEPRYLRITKNMPEATLRAACKVTALHVHIGMSGPEAALDAYNCAVGHFEELCDLGNSTLWNTGHDATTERDGEFTYSPRMKIFRDHLVPFMKPPTYRNWEEFYERMRDEGFLGDIRRLWDFIRISGHGTVEFRMFDTTNDHDRVMHIAEKCQKIIQLGTA